MPDETGPKIIIDEDWKAQAQKEKEQLEKKAREQAAEPGVAGALPPASFSFLVSTLATQAFVSLGDVENPLTGQAERDLDQAKHFIDTLEILDAKTQGNLTGSEKQLLDGVLFELRMRFVELTPGAPGGVTSRESREPAEGN